MPRWTPETRQQQAEAIRRQMPWTHATGPRTPEGKARSARNAWKGGLRAGLRTKMGHWRDVLRAMERSTARLISSFGRKPVFHAAGSPPAAQPAPRPQMPAHSPDCLSPEAMMMALSRLVT